MFGLHEINCKIVFFCLGDLIGKKSLNIFEKWNTEKFLWFLKSLRNVTRLSENKNSR